MPRKPWACALVGGFAGGTVGALLTWVAVQIFKDYGMIVFVGVPFLMGFCSSLIFGYHERRAMSPSLGVAGLSVLFMGVLLLVFAWEGIICMLMAAPLAVVIAGLGGFLGWHLAAKFWPKRTYRISLYSLIVLFPLLSGVEKQMHQTAPGSSVTSRIVIQAPPEEVWPHILSFPKIESEPDWVFRTGIAAPVETRIHGQGVGAARECILSTGTMPERVSEWEPPYRLGFDVLSTPPSMKELTIYDDIHPPHLDSFMSSKTGRFELVRQPDNSTLLIGTSVYENRMWPSGYWLLYSDEIVRRFHKRVLGHIKQLSEAKAPHE